MKDAISVFPNPAAGEINILARKEMTISVVNQLGVVISRFQTAPETIRRYDVHHLSPGVYFIVAVIEGLTIRRKLVDRSVAHRKYFASTDLSFLRQTFVKFAGPKVFGFVPGLSHTFN